MDLTPSDRALWIALDAAAALLITGLLWEVVPAIYSRLDLRVTSIGAASGQLALVFSAIVAPGAVFYFYPHVRGGFAEGYSWPVYRFIAALSGLVAVLGAFAYLPAAGVSLVADGVYRVWPDGEHGEAYYVLNSALAIIELVFSLFVGLFLPVILLEASGLADLGFAILMFVVISVSYVVMLAVLAASERPSGALVASAAGVAVAAVAGAKAFKMITGISL